MAKSFHFFKTYCEKLWLCVACRGWKGRNVTGLWLCQYGGAAFSSTTSLHWGWNGGMIAGSGICLCEVCMFFSHLCVFFQVLCGTAGRDSSNLATSVLGMLTGKQMDGCLGGCLPRLFISWKQKKSKPRCLMISLAARTVVSHIWILSFPKSNCHRVAVSSLCVNTIYLLFNALKAARDRSSCAGTGSGCNRHCVGTWVFVFRGVWRAPTPSHSWALHVWPHLKANPRGKKKEKEKLT